MDGVVTSSGISPFYTNRVNDVHLEKIVREFPVLKSGKNFYTSQVLTTKLGQCDLAACTPYQIKNYLIEMGYLAHITLQNSHYTVPSGFCLTEKAFAIRNQKETQDPVVKPTISPLPVLSAQDVIDYFTAQQILDHPID